jgi:tRNA A37 threonylcarbamoyladenosine synthetase subunit TsaC/SUA5/YrdC
MPDTHPHYLEAHKCLQDGKTILYPTDTVWGIGCDATNETAVDKVFDIKNRPKEKSLIILVDAVEMLKKYVTIYRRNRSFNQLIRIANHRYLFKPNRIGCQCAKQR